MGSAAAQEGDDVIFGDDSDEDVGNLFNEQEAMKGLMYRQHFVPSGLFTIASPVIDFQPEAEEITDNVYSNYNTRTIRYVNPLNANVPLYPANEAQIGPYDERFGAVVDDDFVENDDFGDYQDDDDEEEIVVGDEPIEANGVDEEELRKLRPTIFALRQESTLFGDSDEIVTVEFSPIPEENEEAVYNRFQDEINTGPFDAAVTGPVGGGGDGATGNSSNTTTSGN
ncbi:hypothetical protein [Halopelagius fulvigenes]|uniref:Uncharacterized protein n=1 Tax=Halopelagius fulvigenes TaxID=1198324 RepID=A0ABD5TV31_9EURY